MHFIQDPAFWVAVSFFIFIGLVWKPLSAFITRALDARSDKIAAELKEAVALREEAQSLLSEYQKKQRENLDEAQRIVAQTKEDAKRMAEKAEQDLRDSLEKRKALAMQKIAQAEVQAVKQVQQNVVDIALSGSLDLLQAHLSNKANATETIDIALADIKAQLKSAA